MADLQFPAFDEVEVGGEGGVGDNAFPAFDEVEIPDFDSVDAGGMVEPKQRKPRLGIRDTLKLRSQQQFGVEPESTAHAIVGSAPINRPMRSADQKSVVDLYQGNFPDYKGYDFGVEGGGMGDWLTPPKETERLKALDDADKLATLLERKGDFAKESVRLWRQFEEPKLKPEERDESLKGWLQKEAERELKDRIQAKRDAGKTLDEHERSIWNKMVVGATENAGYQAAFAVSPVLAFATSYADRKARLSTSEYELDDNGRLYLNKAGDTEGTAAMKALVGAGVETGVEILLGKAIGAVAGKVAKGILKGVARKAPASANLIGKVIKKYLQLAKVTKLEDPVGETAEEWVQKLADAGIGLDLKQSEMEGEPFAERMLQAHKDFDPVEVMLSMSLLMGGQTAMSTASATMDHRTLNHELDKSLKLFGGLEDSDLKGVSTKDKMLMARRVAGTMTPEKVEVLTRHLDAKAQQALKKAYDRQNFYDQAQAEGVEPTFTLGGDGKSPYVDAKSGIGIIPEDGNFRVVNRDGADVGAFNSAGEAIAEAKKQSQVNVVLDQQRQKKADYALKEAERLAGGMPVRVFNTEAEMLQEMPEIGESPDYQEGITGVRHKGGMVLVLDNLISPSEVVRTIMHEGGAHEGIRRALGDKAGLNQFLGNLGGEQFEVGKRRLKLGGQEFTDQLTEADEALATVYENRLANPTAYQKSVAWLHDQLRKVNPNAKYTESDIEVLMADAQQKVLRAEGGFDGAYVGPETGRGARGAVEQAQYDQEALRREESFPKRQEQSQGQGQDIEPRKEQPAQAVNADKAEAEKVNERYAQENPQAYREAMQAARGDVAQANRIYEEITAAVPEPEVKPEPKAEEKPAPVTSEPAKIGKKGVTKKAEIEDDPSRVQEIKNSIAEGEMILKSGKTIAGRKMDPDEIAAVRRSVNSDRAKIGLSPLDETQTTEIGRKGSKKKPVLTRSDVELATKLDNAAALRREAAQQQQKQAKEEAEKPAPVIKKSLPVDKKPEGAGEQLAVGSGQVENAMTVEEQRVAANTAELDAKHRLRKPIKGKTGAEIVGYQWVSTTEEGMFRDRRVSDWSEAQTSVPTGRKIVHLFWVKTPDGRETLMGVGAAKKALGLNEQRLYSIAKQEQAYQRYQSQVWDRESENFEKHGANSAIEANRAYRLANGPKPMWPGTQAEKDAYAEQVFNDARLLTKNGKWVRTLDKEAITGLKERGWVESPDDAPPVVKESFTTEDPVASKAEAQAPDSLDADVVFSGVVHPSKQSKYASDMPNAAASFAETMQAIGSPSPGKTGDGVVRVYKRGDTTENEAQNEFTIKPGAVPIATITPQQARNYVREGDRYVFRGEDATPTAAPVEPEAAPPPAPQEPARPASSPDVNDLKREFFKDRGLTLLKLASMNKSQKQKIDDEWKAWYKEQTAKQGATTPAEATQAPVEAAPVPPPNDAPKAETPKGADVDAKGRTPEQVERLREMARKTREAQGIVVSPEAKGIQVEEKGGGDKVVSVPSKDKPGISPKEQKKYLLAEIDKAIDGAIDAKVRDTDTAAQDFGEVTIEVPGDGTFTVFNSKPSLEAFKKAVSARFPTGPAGYANAGVVSSHVRESADDKRNKAVDQAIDLYGNAAEAAKRIRAQADRYEPTANMEQDRKDVAGWLSVADELESRASIQTDPRLQKTPQIKELRKRIREGASAAAESEYERKKSDRVFRAIEALKRHPQYDELWQALIANRKFFPGGIETNPLQKDGDVLNDDPQGKGAPAIRALQDKIAGDLGLRRAKPESGRSRNYHRYFQPFDLSMYWQDVAQKYEPSVEPTASPSRFPRGVMVSTAYNKDGIAYTGRIVSDNADKGTVTIRATKERQKGRNVVARNYGVDKQFNQIVKDVEVAADLVRVIDAVDSGAKRTPVEQAAIEELDREANAQLKEVVGEQTPEVTDEIDAVAKRDDSEDADPDAEYEGTMFRKPIVTPEQDAAYMAAVKAGDVEAAQRMVDAAAKAAGYVVGPLHHWTEGGGGPPFTVFEGGPHHFGTVAQARRAFAAKKKAASVRGFVPTDKYRTYLRIENMKRVGDAGNTEAWNAVAAEAKTEGFDGLVYRNEYEGGGDSYAVFSSSQIKSADAVTYDDAGRVIPLSERFNPDRDDIRFRKQTETPEQVRAYMAVVEAYTNKDGSKKAGWMLAPNGKPTKLQERQWVQVRTPAFKAWFGDWEKFASVTGGVWADSQGEFSKVVDENGEPLEAYHGTADDITVFDEKERGRTTGSASAKRGFFFAKDKIVAEGYADFARPANIDALKRKYEHLEKQAQRTGTNEAWDKFYAAYSEYENAELSYSHGDRTSNLVSAYLSLQNPLVHDFNGSDFRDESYDEIIRRARIDKHDGVILKNTYDGVGDPGGYGNPITDVYVVFNASQIKSATANVGTFDPDNPDINFRPGPRSLPRKQAPTQEDIDKVRNMSLADSYVRAYPSEDPRARVAQAVVELAYGDGLTPKKLEVMLSEGKLAYNSDPQAAELALLAGTTPTGKAEDEARRMARDKFAVNAMTERAVNSGDVDQAATAMLATWRWYERGTETARALRLRFDPLQTPGDRRAWVMRAILTPTDTDIVRAKRALDMRAQVERMKPTAKRALAILKKLRSVSVQDKATGKTRTLDITKFTNEDLMNDDLMNRVMIEIATERASWGDKIHEYWRNSILSGIPTQIVNVLGNAGHAGLEAFIQRPIQAIINSVVGADDAATARSVASMWRAMGPSVRQANINFARAWATENSVTGTRTSKLEDANTAISGRKGRIIRYSQRGMTATDEWFKTVFMSMLTADYGTREFDALLKQGKAVESDRDAYMAAAQQMGTSVYGKAWDETLRWAFQHQPGVIASGVSRWRNDPALGFWMKFIFPFVKTPANIVTTGLRKSPAHLLPYLVRLAKGRYTTDEAIKYGAEQATAMIVMGVLYMLATGDDDDELNRPRITGSRASGGKQKPGERESELRDYPPQSIRFGDRWVSYSRFEPFATMIATMVDVMKMGKSATEGKWGDIPVQAFNSFKGNFRDKTFLSGLGDLIEITESGDEQKAMLTLQKIAAGFSPNLVRSTVRAFDPYIRDMRNRSKGAEWYKTTGKRLVQMALPAPGIAPIPRYDIAGNPVARDGGGIYNALSPFRVQSATRLTPVDAMLKSWNDKQDNDSDKWMPSVPDQPRITYGGVRKEVIKLTDEEYAEFQVLAGKRAERGLELWLSRKQRLGAFRMDDPQERDIEQVKEIYESARQYARDRIRNKVIRRYRLDRSSRP